MSKTKLVAFGNSKGGVGKSSSCQNIAVVLSNIGYKVLCVDMDTQSHLSTSFGFKEPESLEVTLTDLLDKYIKQEPVEINLLKKAIIKTNTVDLLPSTFLMDKLEIALNSINDREYWLCDLLDPIKDDYEYIFLDCNSSRNIFTINALAFAQELIIPCQAQYLSSGAIDLMLSTVKSLKRRINPNLKVSGILMTMYQSNTNQSKETVSFVKDEYSDLMYNTIIPMSTRVPEAQKRGVSVVEFDKNNKVSIAYQEFVKEFLHE